MLNTKIFFQRVKKHKFVKALEICVFFRKFFKVLLLTGYLFLFFQGMGVAHKRALFKDMKSTFLSKGNSVASSIPTPAQRLMVKSTSMIRQSSFSKLINTAVNKKTANGEYTWSYIFSIQ